MHRARLHGASVEFAEHKEYSPGDEIRHVDWRAYAKLDRYYVKQFEQESQLTVYLVLDASASMGYRLHGRALFDRARADALEALDELSGEEPATAVICGGPAPLAPPPSFDRASVRRALSDAELSHGYSDMTACVAAAVRALSDAGTGAALGKRVVVATDLTAAAWRLDAPAPIADIDAIGERFRPWRTLAAIYLYRSAAA
jgi:uncharacterized protein (DUF58 family)